MNGFATFLRKRQIGPIFIIEIQHQDDMGKC